MSTDGVLLETGEFFSLQRLVDRKECRFFFSSRRRHTRLQGDWSSDVCSSDLGGGGGASWNSGRGEGLRRWFFRWLRLWRQRHFCCARGGCFRRRIGTLADRRPP